ncbi:MAG: hypothetical protein B0D92_05505 [Spirochaeta sp. LUC14_002_19_P3]|nr:MAG: hypothetical protein B0D92_05505 [Spirochaeta sp. LUC14_002_19_P3]
MKIWIDGDGCSRKAVEAAVKLARESGIAVEIAADRFLPGLSYAGQTVVEHGSGRADAAIIAGSQPGDLAITRDLSLARQLLNRQVQVLSDRGRVWSEKELSRRLEDAAIMQAMRTGGMVRKQRAAYSDEDCRQFTVALGQLLRGC